MRKIYLALTGLLLSVVSFAQQIPAVEENISYLVTFGRDGDPSWGDDDFSQSFFFVIPKFQTQPFFIRIFDPETSGDNDEKKTDYNTKTRFSIYGGKNCFSARDARGAQPIGNYKSGNLLYTKLFGSNEIYDNEWYTFGPFNPTEGEFVNEYGGYVFKIIAEGISGDDGNLYKYFLSTSPVENKPVEGGNAFTFEYTFRLPDNVSNISHIYPYVEDNVISVTMKNFDLDNDGRLNIVSMGTKGEAAKVSGDNTWETYVRRISAEEKKATLDIQFLKNKKLLVKSNNATLFITNQYGELLPIYTAPIGGTPQHNYKIEFNKKKKTTPY